MSKTKIEQINFLKEILGIPTYFTKEHRLLQYLIKYLRNRPYHIELDIDSTGNLYVTKGSADFFPCVCAHTDSVHSIQDYTIEEITFKDKLRLIGKNSDGYQCGIGADDKAGVFICMELLDQLPNIKVALFAGEEFGCVGSQNAQPAFFKDVAYVMEFDCPANADITHYCNGVQLFEEQGKFYQTIKPILVEHMKKEPTLHRHPYTDVWPLKRMFDFSCINIATGYYQYHQQNEYVIVDEVLTAITMGKEIIQTLGYEKQEFNPSINEIHSYDATMSEMKRRYPDMFKTQNTYTELLTQK